MGTLPSLQRGIGFSGILIISVLVIFFSILLFKLGPVYASYWTIRSVMNTVATSPEVIAGGRGAIIRAVENGMYINDIRNVDSKAITIKQLTTDSWLLSVDYERREHLFFNIDAVLSFSHSVPVQVPVR